MNGKPYCRKCITFKGETINAKRGSAKSAPIHLSYRLSPEQDELSERLITNYKNKIDSMVFAITGAGKTEITLKIIRFCIENGQKAGFAIPRREVAIELYKRFRGIFKKNKIVLVCGGHHAVLDGDLIVLTTHQLYRYEKYFDLLIVDELDAFPYKGNETLQALLDRSIKGNRILMSATPTEKEIDDFKKNGGDVLTLFQRFHKHYLPVPKIIIKKSVFLKIELLKLVGQIYKCGKPLFVFVPTIDECEKIFRLMKRFFRDGYIVHSKMINNQETIEKFKGGSFKYLVTTAVLERGVTVSNLQVIIYHADHSIYDAASLIQISGRVGRKKDAPEGEVIFLAHTITKAMEEAIESISESNKNMQNMF